MFNSIYFNGDEYNQMWLNGNKIWEKNSGEIVYPYSDADSVITYMNTNTSAKSASFTVIDSSLPYSINGTKAKSFSFPASSETQVKLVNLKPTTDTGSTFFMTKIEQLRLPNLTDLSWLFSYFGCVDGYEYSWQPQYFEFSDSVTNMTYMFYKCQYLTDDMMEQFISYFPNTSQVITMSNMFSNCSSLTHLNLSSLNVNFGGLGTNGMNQIFSGCTSLKELHLETWDTSGVDTNTNYYVVADMFGNLTSDIYVNKNTWTLDTHFCSYNATNANFILVDDNGNQEEVFKPQYHTEFASTSNLPSWLSVYSKGSDYYFAYSSSSGCYYNTNTKYSSTTAENVFQIDAPITGTLKVYVSASAGDDTFRFSNKLASDSSYGTTTSIYMQYTTMYGYNRKCYVYEMPVVAGESYHVKIQFYQGQSTGGSYSDSGYIYGFSIDYIPITSINLTHDIGDISNMEQTTFTINPTITPSNYTLSDLEVIYDSTYLLTTNNLKFKLLDGCQGKTLNVTYRSVTDNSISKTITFTVSEELQFYIIDYSQETAPTLPSWYSLYNENSYNFKHGQSSRFGYGLYAEQSGSPSNSYRSTYKFVAPASGKLRFTYSAYTYSSSYPFTIHVKTSNLTPDYSDTTDRIISSSNSNNHTVSTQVVKGTTYYITYQYRHYKNQSSYAGGTIFKVELEPIPLIKSIDGFTYDVDLNNINQKTFTVIPNIKPTNYDTNDLEIIYDSNYMTINPTTFEIRLIDGCQGKLHSVTYRSKENNSVNKSFTFYVNASLEFPVFTVDCSQSTAPTLPDYMTVDYNGTYSFSHGLYTTDIYGLIPSNKGKNSSTAYTRYKYVAPTSGDLTFTYRCYAETSFDYLTVHVDTSTSQPSTTNATNQVFTTKGVSSYQNTDGTASVSVVEGTTYYIHIQYYKDSSSNSGYDMGCIRKIELV